MRNRYEYAKPFFFFIGAIHVYQPVYAQRDGTTVERNDEANQINELYKQGRWEEGKKIAEDELKRNPKDSDMRMLLGKYFLDHQTYDMARYELSKSLEFAPTNVD